jgi:phospholipid/cholesterol/gamma-HCH transport system permease protein
MYMFIYRFIETTGEAAVLAFAVFKTILKQQFSWKEVIRQCFEQANRSLFFLSVTMSFMGAIMVIQACIQAQQLVGDLNSIGPGFLDLLINEFAPTIGATMIATRVGAGIAAEIGIMSVTEQNDALRLCGTDPVSFLVVPRVVAGILMMPLLAIWAACVAYYTGGLVAYRSFHVSYDQYFSIRMIDWHDLSTGLIKALAHGAALTLIASFYGLRAQGGSAGVGNATTKAVIGGIFAVLVLDFILGGLSYTFRY